MVIICFSGIKEAHTCSSAHRPLNWSANWENVWFGWTMWSCPAGSRDSRMCTVL